MNTEKKRPDDEAPRPAEGAPAEGAPAEGGLGLLFIAAAVGLAAILGIVGIVGYWALSR